MLREIIDCISGAALGSRGAEPPVVPRDIVPATAASGVAYAGNRIVTDSVPGCGPARCRLSCGGVDARDLECAVGFPVGSWGAAMRVVVESEVHDNKSALTNRPNSMNVGRAFVA